MAETKTDSKGRVYGQKGNIYGDEEDEKVTIFDTRGFRGLIKENFPKEEILLFNEEVCLGDEEVIILIFSVFKKVKDI